jgi:hypothetical protein
MAIPMQGSWTVSVKSKSAAFPQRFIIAGADSGNGTYVGAVASPPIAVTGAHWRIQIQNDPGTGFINSADQIKFPTVSGGQYRFDIESNDAGADEDFNDLILTCSTPVTQTDFIVYGNATSYSGRCFFPCWPEWLVIDSQVALLNALKYAPIRKAIEFIYPERVVIRRPPIPEPDPPFIPMLIPLTGDQLIPQKRAQLLRLPEEKQNRASDAKASQEVEQTLSLRTVALASSAAKFTLDIDRVNIAAIVDKFIPFCRTETLAGFPLRFEEYDRTGAELSGGPYTGAGFREDLGQAVTDRNGNYIFRFTRSIADFIGESNVDVAAGEDEVVQSMPDLIVKLLDAMAPTGVAFESAPYWNVPVLKRIDLCFRKPARTGCQGGRNIQALGAIRLGIAGTVFDPDGRITCTDTSLPDIPKPRCAAWFDTVRFFGCFIGSSTPVKFYTIRHRRRTSSGFSSWEFYQEGLFLGKIGFVLPQQVGPFDRMLELVDGQPKEQAKAYDNIEQDLTWAASDWFFKADINTAGGSPAYAPSPGTVQFQLQGYDAAGNFVVGATDTVTLYIDNTGVELDLPTVEMGTQDGGECALFHLSGEPDPARLTVRFKAFQRQGFLGSYGLSVRKGNFGPEFGIVQATGPLSGKLSNSYNHVSASNCGELFGTSLTDDPQADPTNYVTAHIVPATGNWLGSDQTFCTFSLGISGTMRRTNGYTDGEDGFGPVTYLLGIEQ